MKMFKLILFFILLFGMSSLNSFAQEETDTTDIEEKMLRRLEEEKKAKEVKERQLKEDEERKRIEEERRKREEEMKPSDPIGITINAYGLLGFTVGLQTAPFDSYGYNTKKADSIWNYGGGGQILFKDAIGVDLNFSRIKTIKPLSSNTGFPTILINYFNIYGVLNMKKGSSLTQIGFGYSMDMSNYGSFGSQSSYPTKLGNGFACFIASGWDLPMASFMSLHFLIRADFIFLRTVDFKDASGNSKKFGGFTMPVTFNVGPSFNF